MNIYDVHPVFRTKEVLEYVSDLVTDYDYTQYQDLSFADKCEFASHLIENEGYEVIMYEAYEAFKKSLNDSRQDDDLLFYMKQSAVKYYEEIMIALIDEIYGQNYAKNECASYQSRHDEVYYAN